MKEASKICLALIVIVGFAFAPGSHSCPQLVEDPTGVDLTGQLEFKAWDLWNLSGPNDYCDENAAGSWQEDYGTFVLKWFNAQNFGGGDDWVFGDTCVCAGSWNENPGTINHKGWYFLFSDTISTNAPDYWFPNDTLRVMPMPVASQIAPGDTVIVGIPNPYETDRPPWGTEEYDVLGYWVVMDSTGTGTEADYDVDLGYIDVDGGPGASTFFKYDPGDVFPVGGDHELYHAYYIVARPETTTTPGVCPGFSIETMSQNSNKISIFGVAEHSNEVPASFSARPSVFTDRTQFAVTLPEQALVNIKLYDAAGQLVTTVCDEVMTAGAHTIDYNGAALPSGVYFYTLQTDKEQLTGQIVKLH